MTVSLLLKNFFKRVCPVSILLFLEHTRTFLKGIITRIKIFLHLPIKKKPDKLKFEMHIVEHCNLNCKGCSNFSPIAETEFVDIEEFRRDFVRLSDVFSHECERIWLMGGEPLLHPEINTLVKIARENFTVGEISVFTNGILLDKMGNEFWQALRDNDIGILISAYPISLPMDKIEALSSKFGVRVQWAWGQGSKERDVFIIRPVNLAGDSNIKLNFGSCPRSIQCITFSHGMLYTCYFPAHVRHFNKYFGKNVQITEADGVNIYDDLTADEMLRKLAEPIPACRYCDLNGKIIKWGISEKKISEWV